MNNSRSDRARGEVRVLRPLPSLIFASRWLQLPLYVGLILAQGVYVWNFWVELVELVGASCRVLQAPEFQKHRRDRCGLGQEPCAHRPR